MEDHAEDSGYLLSPQQHDMYSDAYREFALSAIHTCALDIHGILDKTVFQNSLDKVWQRFEILRTVFKTVSGMTVPLQSISEVAEAPLTFLDISELSKDRQNAAISDAETDIKSIHHDLHDQPPIQCKLVSLSRPRHRLLIGASSLIMDAVSLRLLCQEIINTFEITKQPSSP